MTEIPCPSLSCMPGTNKTFLFFVFFFCRCKECSKCFSDSIGLRDHMDNLHAPPESRIFACDICPKKFLRKHMLTTHKRMTHISEEDKKFACEVCGQR